MQLNVQKVKFDYRKKDKMKKKGFLLLLGLFIFGWQTAYATPADSLRIEYIDGRAYIIHQVAAGETLYSISKRYKVSMNAIAEASPEVKTGLHEGMLLRVPYQPPAKKTTRQIRHTVAAGETLYGISRLYDVSVIDIMEWNDLLSADLEVGQVLKIGGKVPAKETDFVRDGKKIHIVQAGEGLYAIARNFAVSVDDLVAWNNLTTSALNLGQELIVGEATGAVNPAKPAVVASKPQPAASGPRATVKKHENGLAAGIEGSEGAATYLALHRTIPPGTLVAVRNEMNNQVVFVRVVGELPDTGVNDKVIIRLSQAAVKQLHAIDPKFRVEITYLGVN